MLEIFTKTVISFIDKNLSALLLGAAGVLILLFHTFKIPEKWEQINKRLDKIDARQTRIIFYLKYFSVSPEKNINVDDLDSEEFNTKDSEEK